MMDSILGRESTDSAFRRGDPLARYSLQCWDPRLKPVRPAKPAALRAPIVLKPSPKFQRQRSASACSHNCITSTISRFSYPTLPDTRSTTTPKDSMSLAKSLGGVASRKPLGSTKVLQPWHPVVSSQTKPLVPIQAKLKFHRRIAAPDQAPGIP